MDPEISRLKRELAEKEFFIQGMKARLDKGMRLNSETFARIHKLQSEVKKLEALKDALTHMIIHDLNNPLQVIMGTMQLLQLENNLSGELKASLGSVFLAAENMRMMTGNLLDINKMEQGEIVLRPEEFRMEELAAEVAGQMGVIANSEEKTLCLDCMREMPALSADKGFIKRVIYNLLNNAIKHSPAKGVVCLKAFFDRKGKDFHVRVTDSGEGIPKEYLDKIFDKFVQVENKNAKLGHGLGLTFCKMAIEAHAGTIGVESEVNKGSTFYFTLPERNVV